MSRDAEFERSTSEGVEVGREGSSGPETAPVLSADCLGYAEHGGEGECPLVIGFDFGTSASKVVVHAPFVAGKPRYLARLEPASAGELDWLWPSALSVSARGVCDLASDGAGEVRRDIKVRLIRAADGEAHDGGAYEAGAWVTAYLALMLRRIRDAVLKVHAADLRTFARFDWSLNLGIPSGNRPNANWKRLKALFLGAAEAGWRLSVGDLGEEGLRLDAAETAFREALETTDSVVAVGEVEIQAFPEVIAGALGYSRSDARRPGLHLAVDVGASTMDACLFILPTEPTEGDDEEKLPLLVAEVDQLGTAELQNRRIAAVMEVDEADAEKVRASYDPLNPVAAVPTEPWGQGAVLNAWIQADKGMRRNVRGFIGSFVERAKKGRDSRAIALRPGGSLPLVLIGGGSRSEFYQRAVDEEGENMRRHLIQHRGLSRVEVPIPKELDGATESHGHRLAVAVGLSLPSLDLPEYLYPEDIPDVPTQVFERRSGHFVDQSQT